MVKSKKGMSRFLPKSKKGAEMTVGTIIIIVLALIVLVVLVVGFTGGWGNLWGRIINFFGGGSNVDSVVQACQVACTTNQNYEWCTRIREVRFDEKTKESLTCKQLIGKNVNLQDCPSSSISCIEVERGTCSGTPDPQCSAQDNTGEENCEAVKGCEWVASAAAGAGANDGTCRIDSTIKCENYNNKKSECDALSPGCIWTAIP